MTVGSDGCTFLLVHMKIMRNGGSIGSRSMRITVAQKSHFNDIYYHYHLD